MEGKIPLGKPKKRWIYRYEPNYRISGYLELRTRRNWQMIEEWRRLYGAVMGLNGL